MAEVVLILGPSGTGKSHSIINRDPAKTVIINADKKKLPWRGFKKSYNQENKNYVITRDYSRVNLILKDISENRPEVDLVFIDTLYYMIMEEFMGKAKLGGFDKYVDMGLHVWDMVNYITSLRDDLTVVVTSHTDMEDFQRTFSAPGKLVKEKIKPQGLATVVLETTVEYIGETPKFHFMTQHEGIGFAKAPQGMFASRLIPNDIDYVLKCMKAYDEGEDIPVYEPKEQI